MAPDHDNAVNARCPRCRYDQRGPMSTWTDSCPLQGTCSECGLEFNWGEVIRPARFEPPWCVEFVPQVWGLPWACAKTFARSLWPWEFWTRLKMSQPIRPLRLAMYACAVLLLFVLVYAGVQSTLALRQYQRIQQQFANWTPLMMQAVRSSQRDLLFMEGALQTHSMTWEQREEWVASNADPLLGDPSQWMANMRQCWEMPVVQLQYHIQAHQNAIVTMQARAATPPVMNHSRAAALMEAIFQPMAPFSAGTIVYADGSVISYPSPLQNFAYVMGWIPGAPNELNARRALSGFTSIALLTLGLPLSFILLPASRRRAKVRWPHVWRIVTYSLFAPALTAGLMIGTGALLATNWNVTFVLEMLRGIPLVMWIILPMWWAVAIKRYLHMPHAARIAAVMAFVLALAMTLLMEHVLPEWIMSMVLNAR